MTFRHSKIVCTIGPASCSPRMIRRLIEAGMDVARLNFSHGTHEKHAQTIAMLHAAPSNWKNRRHSRRFAGPQNSHWRARRRQPRHAPLRPALHHHHRESLGRYHACQHHLSPASARSAPRRSHPALGRPDRIARRKNSGPEVICQVVNGGALGEHKGINLPGIKLRVPALTEKDRDDFASPWSTARITSP